MLLTNWLPSLKRTRRFRRHTSRWRCNYQGGSVLSDFGRAAELLEDRTLLSIDAIGVTSAYGDFRFLAGPHEPDSSGTMGGKVFHEVTNRFEAQVQGDTPSKVDFQIGGQRKTDTTASDGWWAEFNMSSLTTVSDLAVTAYEGTIPVKTEEFSVDLTLLPDWMRQPNVEYEVSATEEAGYTIDVYSKDLDYGFPTPDDWEWQPRYFEEPLIDLSGLRTGFDTGWNFTVLSSPAGEVTARDTGYRLHAEVLGFDIWNQKLATGEQADYRVDLDRGIFAVHAEGSYSISFNPSVDNNLLLTGVSGTADASINFDTDITLFQAEVAVVGLPFIGSLAAFNVDLKAGLTVGFDGSTEVVLENGALGIKSAEFHPDVGVHLKGGASGKIGNLGPWSVAKAGVTVSGGVTQAFEADYSASTNEWRYDAPGSVRVGGELWWDTVGQQWDGKRDLFVFEIAGWNFVKPPSENPPEPPPEKGSGPGLSVPLPEPMITGPPMTAIQRNHFVLDSWNWCDDDRSGNDNDGVLEAGEHPQLRLALKSNADVPSATHVEAVLGAEDSDINVTRRKVYFSDFSDFAGNASNQSVGAFEMELGFADRRTSNFDLYVTYMIDDQPYYQSLIFPEPVTFYAQGERTPDLQPGQVVVISTDNENTTPEPGEAPRFDLVLNNVGEADADNIRARIFNSNVGQVNSEWRYYPRMHAGSTQKQKSLPFSFDREIPTNFTGQVTVDIAIEYDGLSEPKVYTDQPLFFIAGRDAFIQLDYNAHDFGIIGTTENATISLNILNFGTGDLHVTDIEVYAVDPATEDRTLMPSYPDPGGDTAYTPADLPWNVAPGDPPRPFEITVHGAAVQQPGRVIREVVVISDGQLTDMTPPSNTVLISGIVADTPEARLIPGTSTRRYPDVSGTIIVSQDSRHGDQDIYAFDFANNTEFSVCVVEGSNQEYPKIGGDWIAWEDNRNGNWDIFAYEISTGQETPVATEPSEERLAGVDGGQIAFRRKEHDIPEIWNLYWSDGTAITTYAPDDSTVRSVDAADFGDGLLVWNERIWESTGSDWAIKPDGWRVMKMAAGDAVPVEVTSQHRQAGHPTTNGGQIAWRQLTAETITGQFYAEHDTYIRIHRDGSDYDRDHDAHGEENRLRVYLSPADEDEDYVSLLRFDLSSVPSTGITVDSAQLHIYKTDGPTVCGEVEMQKTRAVWDETTVTPADHPDWSKDFRGGAGTNQWQANGSGPAWEVHDLSILDWITDTNFRNYGLALRPLDYWRNQNANTFYMNGPYDFVSSEGEADKRPFLEVAYTPNARNQWWSWDEGGARQLTSDSVYEHVDPVLVDGCLAYRSPEGVLFWKPIAGVEYPNGEGLLVDMPGARSLRADGNTFVWQSENRIYYTFAGPDVSVASPDISFSEDEPVEGDSIAEASVTVRNVGLWDAAEDVTVRLYNGDPDAKGAEQWGPDQVIPGGIAARSEASVVFSNLEIPVGWEGTRDIYARITVPGADNPSNNTAFATLEVGDSDTEGPVIASVVLAEQNGDGDGIVGADEQVRIVWSLSDASGISSTQLWVDVDGDGLGTPDSRDLDDQVTLGGDYFATFGPLNASEYDFAIDATDADNTSASSTYAGSFDVVPSEEITVFYNGQPLVDGETTPIDFGSAAQGSDGGSKLFVVRNDGEQVLSLGAISVPTGFSVSGPASTLVLPHDSTYFALTLQTDTLGPFQGNLSLANSDGPRSPDALDESTFAFTIRGEIVMPEHPVVLSIVRAETDPTNESTVGFTVTFSEDVTGVNAANFVLATTGGISGASLAAVKGSGATYAVSVETGNGDGTIRLDLIDDDSILDVSGNPLGDVGTGNGDCTTGERYTVDKTAPSVVSVVRANGDPPATQSVGFVVTFSESVTGVAAADFVLTTTGDLAAATVTDVAGSGSVYTVTVDTGSGYGSIRLDVVDDDSVLDDTGNALGGPGVGSGDYTDGEHYTLGAQILGMKWNDADGDGIYEPDDGETGLAGWTIFLDENGNGEWGGATAEPHYDVTGADGTYTITGVPAGTYKVAEVPQPGWQQTYPTASNGAEWHLSTPLNVVRGGSTAAVLGTSIYAISGDNTNGSVEVYDTSQPSSGWQMLSASLSRERDLPGAATVGTKIYVVGGWDAEPLSTMEMFDVSDPSAGWQVLPVTLNVARDGLAAGAVGTKIYAIGGRQFSPTSASSTVEMYDTSNPSAGWQLLPSLNSPRELVSVAVVGSKIYAIGGSPNPGNLSASVEVLDTSDPGAGWQLLPAELNTARMAHGAATVGTRIYVVAGVGGEPLSTVEMYDVSDPAAGWQLLPARLSIARLVHAAPAVGTSIYAIGGYTDVVEVLRVGGVQQSFNVAVSAGEVVPGINFGNRSLMDFGDAPNSYGTTLASNGARHIATGPMLGAERNTEPDAQPPLDGTGDDTSGTPDDEDGVTFSNDPTAGQDGIVSVTVSGAGELSFWIDFDQSGTFENSTEKFDHTFTAAGTENITFAVPSSAKGGQTYARFRLSTSSVPDPTGFASDGEVEDYHVEIVAPNDFPPVADDESFTVAEGGTATQVNLDAGTSLLDGDTDNDLPNDTLTVDATPATAPSHGTVSLNADGTFRYTHDGSENLTDSFEYTVRDTANQTDIGLVTITITPSAADIGNFVWMDTNKDGDQDTGEPGVSGVTVELFAAGGDSKGTDTTDDNGLYLFENLPAGTYYLEFRDLPTEHTFAIQDAGGDDGFDSDPDPATGRTAAFTFSGTADDLTCDAGIVDPSPSQIVTGADRSAPTGGAISIPADYTTSDNDNTLTGLTLRMHFDSSKLTFNGVDNVFQTGFSQQQLQDDTQDLDNDSSTDKFVNVLWFDVSGNWTGQPSPTRLYDANFTLAEGLSVGTVTTVNFTGQPAISHSFCGESLDVTVVPPFCLDVDDDGQALPLSDGILIIRYLAGFAGQPLVEDAVNPVGGRTEPDAIHQFAGDGRSYLDVDLDGQTLPLSDGILIIRYLAGFTGQPLVEDAVNPQGGRTEPGEILAYLDGIRTCQTQFLTLAPEAVEAQPSPSPVPSQPTANTEPQDDLEPIVETAISLWADAGVSEDQLDRLHRVNVSMTNVAGPYLASTSATGVVIDVDAAGQGWFINGTPLLNEEFLPSGENSELRGVGNASSSVDLLTVVTHELGHTLGLDHASGESVMSDVLPVGIRRLPKSFDLIDAAFSVDWDDYLLP